MKYSFGILIGLLASCTMLINASAQKKKKKQEDKVPVYNYVIDDPIDVFGRQTNIPDENKNVLLPDFCHTQPIKKGDTTYTCLLYDRRQTVVRADTLKNADELGYVSITRKYLDPVEKYKDAEGQLKPLPIEQIVMRYDKMGSNTWLTVNYINNKKQTLTEDRSIITNTITDTIMNYALGNKTIVRYQLFKTTPK